MTIFRSSGADDSECLPNVPHCGCHPRKDVRYPVSWRLFPVPVVGGITTKVKGKRGPYLDEFMEGFSHQSD